MLYMYDDYFDDRDVEDEIEDLINVWCELEGNHSVLDIFEMFKEAYPEKFKMKKMTQKDMLKYAISYKNLLYRL